TSQEQVSKLRARASQREEHEEEKRRAELESSSI
ncbi:hypothetical protein A2U01_0080783, partial [Trifolium medium]|nr:hypothetical protein [Trifolium medium]